MWRTGLVAPRHVGSSWTRARTRVPCIGRRILNHCATREAQIYCFNIEKLHIHFFCLCKYEEYVQQQNNCKTIIVEGMLSVHNKHLRYMTWLFLFFISGCIGSLPPCAGFPYLRRAGATLRCVARASHCGGLSHCGAQALGTRAQ